ncbi:ATP-binding cassette protein [Histoplasma capsulatum G186AR]|uniref:ATP-binding cassette protein n=2 Tax=Ajellomyces capsulatus TaxID=5037 RepID=C0NEE9_AJECG|nr:ATP-binding cassette protein [Histoplasma capsulatum G186AR]EEH09620.1 ATP-binding cassette protein [Histoplasma capsulatum G186AR]
MASQAAAPTIIANCKQTRFHVRGDADSTEIDIQGLNITIIPSGPDPAISEPPDSTKSKSAKHRGKSKAKSDGVEILSNADLHLKAGVHYGLVGRNGTGKSTILRALAEKLIPGIPNSIRVSILQQTDGNQDALTEYALFATDGYGETGTNGRRTVLQEVMRGDVLRNDVERKIRVLSHALEETGDSLEPVRAIRQLRHEELERELFLAQKNASLRSGSRGMQARKDLKVIEQKVAESADLVEKNRDAGEPSEIKEETQAALDLLNELQCQYEAMKITDIEAEARRVLLGLGFKESALEQPFESLSGGWRMRCMLAGSLVQKADIMILDEPTNFLDLLGIVWLENYFSHFRAVDDDRTVILVSHDRDFLNNVCEETIILKDQTLAYFKGNISAYEEDLGAQKLYWGRMKAAQDRQVAHMEATIRDNIKLGKKTGDDNKLRMAKSRQKKVNERMGVQVSAKGTRFKLNRDRVGYHDSMRDEIEVPQDEKGVSISIPDPQELRFPGPLVSLESVHFWYKPKSDPILNGIDLVIHMGDRVGIMGLNGSGKTTLLKVLMGSMQPKLGTVSRHPRVAIGYYSQHSVDELKALGRSEPVLTALSLICRDANGSLGEGEARGLLSSLGLIGRTASDVPITQLSGGQLVRLALARIILNLPHLLVLDEITTHLDFHTVVALIEDLSSFSGAILLVSHDRYLVRGVVENKRAVAGQDGNVEMTTEPGDDDESRRRSVYILRRGKLRIQENGVEQFEESLQKRVQTLMRGH